MKRNEQTVLVRSIKNPKVTRRMTVNSARLNSSYWETVPSRPIQETERSEVTIIDPEGSYNVAAIIPVHGRIPLVKQTIHRLLLKNNLLTVICVCSSQEDIKALAGELVVIVEHENKPLGAKWNAGFVEAKKFNPDACLFVGSSDWLSDNWVSSLLPLMDKYDMVGTPGCHFLDIKQGNKFRAVDWGGYLGERSTESIGIGRLLSHRIMDKIGWKPFDDTKDGSLDYSMFNRVKKAGGKVSMINHPELISLSISTDLWPNKHSFDDNISGELRRNTFHIKNVSEFLKKNFPEAYHIFK